MLDILDEKNITLSVVTKAATFETNDGQTELSASTYYNGSIMGLNVSVTNQQSVDIQSPIIITIHDLAAFQAYIVLAKLNGGIAFDLDYFDGDSNIAVSLFRIMFHKGTFGKDKIIYVYIYISTKALVCCST